MSKSLRNSWRNYRALPPLRRELTTFALMLVVALTVLPLAIWSAGRLFLGEYLRTPPQTSGTTPTGGPLALLADFAAGVLAGSPGHWLVLLGPYLLLLAFRAARAVSRK